MENNSVDIMWKKYLKSIDENEEDTRRGILEEISK